MLGVDAMSAFTSPPTLSPFRRISKPVVLGTSQSFSTAASPPFFGRAVTVICRVTFTPLLTFKRPVWDREA